MSCNKGIHNVLKKMGQLMCDFCDLKLVDNEIVVNDEMCCEKNRSGNNDRKRMISVKFVLRRIFRILEKEYKCIPLSESKKTLKFYNIRWKQIYKLIKDDICVILRKTGSHTSCKGGFPYELVIK